MKRHTLIKTNLIISIIIIIGFLATSFISYRLNSNVYEEETQYVSALAADSIDSHINSIFNKPIHFSQAMANDSFLIQYLAEEKDRLDDEAYIQQLQTYLNKYREEYNYDNISLISTATNRYYHFNGLDRILSEDNAEDVWYYEFLNREEAYSINIGNDKAKDDSITIFINCKIEAPDGSIMGVIGIGFQYDYLQEMLISYNEQFDVEVSLVSPDGTIEVSSKENGYQDISIYDAPAFEQLKQKLSATDSERHTYWYDSGQTSGYVVATYIPSLKWYMVIDNDTTYIKNHFVKMLILAILVLIGIITIVLCTITKVFKHYNEQIVKLTITQEMEYHRLIQKATEDLYQHVFELNITSNRVCGESTQQYFISLGLTPDTPYDVALRTIAFKQIKPEYIQEYLNTFSTANLLKLYHNNINHVRYELMMTENGTDYYWTRIQGQIFYWQSDNSVRFISYRRNINEEKRKELQLIEKSQKDEMTGLYNKITTEELISSFLDEGQHMGIPALLLFDIDNFKSINDTYGHAFGDIIIMECAHAIRTHFRSDDIVGRIGGDEFIVLMKNTSKLDIIKDKLERLSDTLSCLNFEENEDIEISVSIGIACYPIHGTSYSELFEKADQALYYSKDHGKNMITIYGEASSIIATRVTHRDLEAMLDNATDGAMKIAYQEGNALILYSNQTSASLIGLSLCEESEEKLDILTRIHPKDLAALHNALKQAIVDKKPFTLLFRLLHRDGHYIPIKARNFQIDELYEDQYPVFYTVFTDLSDIISVEDMPFRRDQYTEGS